MRNNHIIPSSFPDENLDPRDKESPEYGLDVVKAIWYHHSKFGSPLFINRARSIKQVYDYIFGRQDQSQYKPIAGVDPMSGDQSNFIKGIRWDVKAYGAKRFNVAVSKISNMRYDPVCDAVDEAAIDMKQRHANRIRVLMDNRELLDQVGMLAEMLPPNMLPEDLPSDSAQLEEYLADYKLFAASVIEEAVKEHIKDNDYEQIKREIAQDLVAKGIAIVDTSLDDNLIPRIDRWMVERTLLPKSDYPDFRDIKYIAYVDFLTYSDLEKEAQGSLTKEQLREVSEKAKSPNTLLAGIDADFYSQVDEAVGKIPVLRFRWKSTDVETYAKKIDLAGNPKLYKKKNNYKGEGKNEKIQHKYNSIYEGVWPIGLDFTYNYRRKHYTERRRGNMNEAPLGVHIYAPNMIDNKLSSIGEQMVPILDDLQVYNIKLRHILASPFPGGVEINLRQLKNVEFNWGSKKMGTKELVEFLFQKKILLTDRDVIQGANDSGMREMNIGVQLQEYLALIQNALSELDEILGLNPASVGSQLGERAGARTTQLQMQASETALDYLFYADKKIFMEVCKSLAVLHGYSQRFGEKGRYNRILGKLGVQALDDDFDLTKHDYSFDLEMFPSQEQWDNFYMQVEKASVPGGSILPSDAVMLRRVDNLKKAEMMLKRMERIKRKRDMDAERANQEYTTQAQQASNQQANENRMSELQMEAQIEGIKGEEARKTLKLKYQLEQKKLGLEKDLDLRNQEARIGDEMVSKVMVESSKPEKSANVNKK